MNPLEAATHGWRRGIGALRAASAAARVDDALSAQRSGVRHAEIEEAFGADAAREAALARRLRSRQATAHVPDAGFVNALEGRLRAAHARARARREGRLTAGVLRRSIAAASIAAGLVAGGALAPAGGDGAVRASAAPIAAAARTPDDAVGPTPRARLADVRRLADAPASVAKRPDADATRLPIGALH